MKRECCRGQRKKSLEVTDCRVEKKALSVQWCVVFFLFLLRVWKRVGGFCPLHPVFVFFFFPPPPPPPPPGRRRVDGTAPQPSRVVISDRPIVVTTSLPPSPPRPAPAPRKPTVTLLEVKSDRRRRPPKLTVQVRPVCTHTDTHTHTYWLALLGLPVWRQDSFKCSIFSMCFYVPREWRLFQTPVFVCRFSPA